MQITLNWNVLEKMMCGLCKIPPGCRLEYEYRPSLDLYPSIHEVHAYWQRLNPDAESRDFWFLSDEEQKSIEDNYIGNKYRQFAKRREIDCYWQRFTLTNPNGTSITLQLMDGRVDQIRIVDKIVQVPMVEIVR